MKNNIKNIFIMKIGTKLKELSFTLDDDTEITNKDLKGKKLIIYFYPKDDTPGCTKEAIGFSSNLEKFSEKNTDPWGIKRYSSKASKIYF